MTEQNPKKNAADFLQEIAGIYRERKPLYGDNYKHVGRIMRGIFPDGLAIEEEEDWNRLHLVFHMVSKLTRYCQNLQKGGHQDSLDDLAVYAMLARECDVDWAARRGVPNAVPVRASAPSEDSVWAFPFLIAKPEGTLFFRQEDLDEVNRRRSEKNLPVMSREEVEINLHDGEFEDKSEVVEWLAEVPL